MKKEKEGMKKVLVLALVVMLAASSAWAYNDALHVKQAANGKGDLVVFPVFYTATDGWQTSFTVINTSNVYSVVAKVVLHSHYYSQELLDFLLYLSPNDVWTGTLVNDGTDVRIQSTDDSALAANGLFASATNPMNQIISQATCIPSKQTTQYANDSRDFGYIEVVEAWYGDLSLSYYSTGNLKSGENAVPPQVSKTYLKRVYDKYAANTGLSTCFDCLPGAPAGLIGYVAGVTPGTFKDSTINVLTGYFELQNSLHTGYSAAHRATIFADWDNVSALTTAAATGFMSNPSRNSTGEIEAALSKQDLAMPYTNKAGTFSVHALTFPTKAAWSGVSTDASSYCRFKNGSAPFWIDATVNANNPFATTEYRCVPYTLVNYDLTELASASGPYSAVTSNNGLCEEVNLLFNSPNGFGTNQPIAIYDEGWSRYFLGRTTANRYPTNFSSAGLFNAVPLDHSYYGAPVIPTVLFAKNGTLSLMNGAYSDGAVYGEVILPGTSDPNSGSAYGRLSARNNNVVTMPGGVAGLEGAWPWARYNGIGGVANAINATPALIIPPFCLTAGLGPNICTWLPEYQYSNEINDLGITPITQGTAANPYPVGTGYMYP
jgi:hypothetical protein